MARRETSARGSVLRRRGGGGARGNLGLCRVDTRRDPPLVLGTRTTRPYTKRGGISDFRPVVFSVDAPASLEKALALFSISSMPSMRKKRARIGVTRRTRVRDARCLLERPTTSGVVDDRRESNIGGRESAFRANYPRYRNDADVTPMSSR